MLTSIAAALLGSTARKAVMAGLTGVGSAIVGPEIIHVVQGGIAEGVTPAAHQLGVVIGGALGGAVIFLINHLPTWFVPNKK